VSGSKNQVQDFNPISHSIHQSSDSMWLDHLWRDIRYALRMLRKSPGFTAVAVLTIALGVGATTAIFSLVNATLLHPLPYPNPGQLVSIEDDLEGRGAKDVGMSISEWKDLQNSGIFDYVSPAWFDDNNLTGGSEPERVRQLTVAPNYFALLGVKPQLGNTFDPHDPTPGYNLQVVISDGLWKRSFGSDPKILGKAVQVDGDWYRVIAVMPPDFYHPGRTPEERGVEVWSAAGFSAAPFPNPPLRSLRFPGVFARVKAGVTLAEAQERINALVASLQKQYPVDYPAQNKWAIRLLSLKQNVVGDVRQPLLLLLGAVALVLLIGCVNVANLLLARGSTRKREMAIRQALGALRMRLTRQLLTESLCLALLGGITALLVLIVSKPLLLQFVPHSLPRLSEVSINWSVLLFALGASVVAGVIFGLVPALHGRQLNLTPMLKQESRGATGSGEQVRTRRVLVVLEFAFSLVLMIAASLLLRSFWDLLNVDLGFNPQRVMAVRTRLPEPNDIRADHYAALSQETPFLREVLHRVRNLPGVEEVALGNSMSIPLDHRQRRQNMRLNVIFEGRAMDSSSAALVSGVTVSPEYFHLMDIKLLRGHLFTDSDGEKTEQVVVINEAMAQTYWPNEDPLGKHLKLSLRATSWSTVIGIVANARTESLEDAKVPQIYASLYQRAEKRLTVFLRGHLDTAAIPGQVREQVQSIDPQLPVFGDETINEAVSSSLSVRRFSMQMTALFALTALLLAGLGIYGVISYVVTERTHEIGIQLALGAQRGSIMKMVLRQGLILAIIGAAVGLVGALVVSRLMSGLLYGVRPTDPVTFIGVTTVLTAVALAACYIPARRAIRIDPITALRRE
jgi:predicted permease